MIPVNTDFTILYYGPLASSLDSGYLGSLEQAWNRKMVQAAFGGFWSYQFHLRGKHFVDEWINDGVGRHIEVYDPALQIIWEGFANKVDANIGTMSISRGPLLEMGNKVKVMYSTIDWELGEPAYGQRDFTDWAEDSDSQAKYGIIERVVSTAGASLDRSEQIRDLSLEEIKFPGMDEEENLELSSIPSVTVECLGYIHWCENYTVTIATTGEQYASAKIETVLGQEPNGIFSTDYNFIDENQTPVGAYENSYRTGLSLLKGITALGDDSQDRWLLQCEQDRRFKLNAIPSSVAYARSLVDWDQNVKRYPGGGDIMPWSVKPGNWIWYSDLFPGHYLNRNPDYRTDLAYSFIEEATFREPWNLQLKGTRISSLKQLLNQFGVGGFHS